MISSDCIFQGRDLEDTLYLDAINSLLVCGEYPHLFSNDEMDGLLQVMSSVQCCSYLKQIITVYVWFNIRPQMFKVSSCL